MSRKQLWLLVGGNGAGKSTFFELFLKPKQLAFVNADRIARQLAPEGEENVSYEAAIVAERIRYDMLEQGRSFCFETVFSHPSKIDFTAHAKALGYEVILVFIHLDEPSLNLARISQRVSEGGHDVPEKKVRDRISRTMHNVVQAMPLADEVHLIDNASWEHPFRRVAVVRHGEVERLIEPIPTWALTLLEQTPA